MITHEMVMRIGDLFVDEDLSFEEIAKKINKEFKCKCKKKKETFIVIVDNETEFYSDIKEAKKYIEEVLEDYNEDDISIYKCDNIEEYSIVNNIDINPKK